MITTDKELKKLGKKVKISLRGSKQYRNAVSRYLTAYLFLYCNQYSLDTPRERRIVAAKIAKTLNKL